MRRHPSQWLLLGVSLAAGCGDEPNELYVDLRTDLVPGLEFASVRTEVVSGTSSEERPAYSTDDFRTGRRVAELDGLTVGRTVVLVSVLDSARGLVASRQVVVDVQGATAVLVVLTRDCRSVRCPAEGGDPALDACLDGRCVPAECTSGREPSCPTMACASDAECPVVAECAVGTCREGVCFREGNDSLCPAGTRCQPDVGCVNAPETDGGMGGCTCDDGVACTIDACDGLGACSSLPDDTRCTLQPDGYCHIALGCQYPTCSAETCVAGPCETARCEGAVCMRESMCAPGESCCGDACVPVGCDDGNSCTTDACISVTGCAHTPIVMPCDDGMFCNGADTCDPTGGCSTHAGDPCPGESMCDETGRTCVGCATFADCPAPSMSPWSACEGFDGECDESGVETQISTTFTCVAGDCIRADEPMTRPCTRPTEGAACGTGGECTGGLCCVTSTVRATGSGCNASDDLVNVSGAGSSLNVRCAPGSGPQYTRTISLVGVTASSTGCTSGEVLRTVNTNAEGNLTVSCEGIRSRLVTISLNGANASGGCTAPYTTNLAGTGGAAFRETCVDTADRTTFANIALTAAPVCM